MTGGTATTREPDPSGPISSTVDDEPRCSNINCGRTPGRGRVLARLVARPWEIMCPRCKHVNTSPGYPGGGHD
jgi:hypothetical protein